MIKSYVEVNFKEIIIIITISLKILSGRCLKIITLKNYEEKWSDIGYSGMYENWSSTKDVPNKKLWNKKSKGNKRMWKLKIKTWDWFPNEEQVLAPINLLPEAQPGLPQTSKMESLARHCCKALHIRCLDPGYASDWFRSSCSQLFRSSHRRCSIKKQE